MLQRIKHNKSRIEIVTNNKHKAIGDLLTEPESGALHATTANAKVSSSCAGNAALLSPLACSVGDTSFPAQSSTWLHRYYLNWTKLDNAITKFNNEMHSADNWVLNPVILHYWQNLPILILCSALLQFVLLKVL